MFTAPYYHIGMVVHDLQDAAAHYSGLLDITFTEPTDSVLCIENPQAGQSESIKVVAAYSRSRAPYLELIQANGNGIFSVKNAGGILYAVYYSQIQPLMGVLPGLKAFVAAVLGGIGNIPGAALGGMILGLVETFVKGSRFSTFSDAIAFAVLILISV